jgi:alpha-galactosidase/6-phospho-beta-glucosidase family protein
VKAYESLTVWAAVRALSAHPLAPSWEVARPALEELLVANQRWIDWAKWALL